MSRYTSILATSNIDQRESIVCVRLELLNYKKEPLSSLEILKTEISTAFTKAHECGHMDLDGSHC
jgi:hypothetical protein